MPMSHGNFGINEPARPVLVQDTHPVGVGLVPSKPYLLTIF